MKFSKKIVCWSSLFFVLLLGIGLAGCGKQQTNAHGHDYVKIYNRHDKLIKTLSNAKSIAYFSDFVGDKGGDSVDSKPVKTSDHAKVIYRYLMHQNKGNVNVTMKAFSNVKYMTVSNIAGIVGPVTFRVSNKEFHTFNHPKKLIRKLSK
ncbi:hypothetical protein FD06_GL000722 [Apilactobacillus ozensis DSM 23829 = JCM 17196]|uniref:Lipoprotein n=1 Tax=Apilactobacillus ozensis DSM 23829 = JCM 17196 TaxID=1423781 RepID=A0A0R2AWG3_9LACO|nr:hypothetical protein [Apilactobacillus ozensis]KRM67571.1 hypothetical protein FD06_GL000722 [Apilactobacillus ozensis DSM 23829 = JCM 17196]